MSHASPRRIGWLILLLVFVSEITQTIAQEKLTAFVGGTIIPVAADPIENGVLLVEHGQIKAVGSRASTTIPAGTPTIDFTGRVIMPGLVDTHSHIGQVALADKSSPIHPDVRAFDSVNVRDASIQRARAGGITTVNIMPGSGTLIGGQTVYLKLRRGNTIDDLMIKTKSGRVAGGLKMANGTNPQGEPPFPGTRGKAAALVREKFVAAQDYRDKIARAKADPEKMPARDLSLETLVEVLNGDRVVHHHTHRHDDIMTVLRLQKEFGFRLVLQHVSEGYKVAQEIAAAKVACSVIVIDSPGGKLEARDMDWKTGGVLERAGVVVGFHTDDYVTDSRLFLRSAALGVRSGMSRPGALKAVTQAGAVMLDLQERVGTLEPGKDADFVVLSGDPFSVYTDVVETWIEGVKVFDRSDPADRLIATGGYGSGNPRTAHLCCFNEGGETR